MTPKAMRWASAYSGAADPASAALEACGPVLEALGEAPDLAIACFGPSHVPSAPALAQALRRTLRPACLMGASAHGVIWTEHEVETGPALTLIAARLPGVELRPFLMVQEAWAELEDAAEFAELAPGAAKAELVLFLGDPFTLDAERCLKAFNRHAPGVRLVGGLASAGARPGANALFLNDWAAREGGVALALSGALRADVVVSQGCRPVGPPLEVTRVDGNVLIELDGRPALERIEQVLAALAEPEREQLKNGLYVGRPARPGATGQGDYLIRNLLGADRDRGVLAIGDVADEHERVRLHVRDADTAREDLEMLLSPQAFDARAAAALVFSCNGRGRALFKKPDGDIDVVQDALGGGIPVAGMFCAGEIGPVGGKNHVHGHSVSLAVLRPPAAPEPAAGGR